MSNPGKIVTEADKSPLIQVLTLMFLVIAVLACFVRTGTKYLLVKGLRIDDILVLIATILAVGQSVAVFEGCERGLGRHIDTLNSTDINAFFKVQYAANTMFIASLLCSKLAGTMDLRMLSRGSQRWATIGCEAFVGLWGVSALVVNFCLWRYDEHERRVDRTAFWTYYSIAIIATDAFFLIIMSDNVRRIQTSWDKKVLVMSVFGCRILVAPVIVTQIYYSNRSFPSADYSFSAWEATIAMQLVQCLAILTVCVPSLKPFLESVESGQMRVDDLRRQGKSSSNGYQANRAERYGRSTYNTSGSRSVPFNTAGVPTTTDSGRSNVYEMVNFVGSRTRGTERTTTIDGGVTWDGQSHRSHSSQTILVHQTWQIEVQSMHDRAERQN